MRCSAASNYKGDIDALFALLVGQLVWNCQCGSGPALTLEFGKPRQVVREPNAGSTLAVLQRGRVTIAGRLHFWALSDRWLLQAGDRAFAETSEATLVDDALQRLDGLRLSQIGHDAGSLAMAFDLGGSLRLFYETSKQRWTLYE